MTDLIVAQNNLPTTLEDLSKFVLIGRDKLQAVRAEISALKNLNLAKEVREQKLAEGQEIGKLVLLAEARLGELFKQMPKATSENNLNGRAGKQFPPAGKLVNNESKSEEEEPPPKPKLEVAAQMGFNKNQVSQFQKLADNPDAVQAAIDYAEDNDTIATRTIALMKIKQAERAEELTVQVNELEQQSLEKPDGLFDVIVVDPPWNYGTQLLAEAYRAANPYPELTQDELKAIELPAADNCVLFLWTTHKFIWDAKELLDHWHFDYRCMLVWNKQKLGTGNLIRMQCEFCLIGLKGKPVFKDVHNIRDLIDEPRREHSRKPDAFYQLVDELCAGRKLDYFSRQQREGWTTYGNDTEKFSVA